MSNKYIQNSETNKEAQVTDANELLLQIMQQEYPNDPVYKEGRIDGADLQANPFG